ncbi:MAG: butyrate kinase [Clostridiaceae bacterium]
MAYFMLVINPGSTSTKIAIFQDETPVFTETLKHSTADVSNYSRIYEQLDFRKEVILQTLKDKSFDTGLLHAAVGRGGLLKPVESGTYEVNDLMVHDLKIGVQGQHASNLGGILAYEIAKPLKIPAHIVDPVVVDEMEEVAKLTGLPEIERKSIFHALNQKAVARRYAAEKGKNYNELDLIVVHMGGGITIGAHRHGRVIDVNDALDGEGPFSPDRSGGLPARRVVEMCFSGKYTQDQMHRKIAGQGGYVAYFDTNDARLVEKAASEGDKRPQLVQEAMVYQIAEEIGKSAVALSGKVDAILLTGGLAFSNKIVGSIRERIEFIAPVFTYPGENEMLALAQGCLRVLTGAEKAKEYK